MYDYWLIGAIVVMFIGVLGTFLPVIPGIPLIFIAMIGYGFAEGFHLMTPLFLGINLVVVILATVLDYLGTAWGARRFGASSSGTWGAAAGGVLGLIVLGPIGLIAGPFIGAVAGELWNGRSLDSALEAGVGTMLGLAGASAVRFVFALSMVIAFIWRVW
ncbi:DUF456 family protein [Heliobacillus mobilis]|uniref:DUF456 family protein n=1 Tax=Heliobacterium mobile TaxID=28064 RepID=A0A6I3SGI6_HELMO|nr:DUF456 domain-containing protein [Heliobacterium mobile]MTV47944.1 DUF456 family protein [Heliobacterium mobile]